MRKVLAAIRVLVSLISVCADCAAVVELFFKFYDATKEGISEFFYRRINGILDLARKFKICGIKLINRFEKICWHKRYILI